MLTEGAGSPLAAGCRGGHEATVRWWEITPAHGNSFAVLIYLSPMVGTNKLPPD